MKNETLGFYKRLKELDLKFAIKSRKRNLIFAGLHFLLLATNIGIAELTPKGYTFGIGVGIGLSIAFGLDNLFRAYLENRSVKFNKVVLNEIKE